MTSLSLTVDECKPLYLEGQELVAFCLGAARIGHAHARMLPPRLALARRVAEPGDWGLAYIARHVIRCH